MGHYLSDAPTKRATPQSEPIPGAGQVENSAGGHAWAVDPLTRLRRFLILGSEGGSYYASEAQLTGENVASLAECDPMDAVKLIVAVSEEGRAPKNDPAIFALAYYSAHEKEMVRTYALAQLSRVCRTSTHLFQFAEFVQKQRGWGRSLRRAVGRWYTKQSAEGLAYQAVKYRQREGWTHADLLRLAHPGSAVSSGNPTLDVSPEHRAVFDWVVRRANYSALATGERHADDALRIVEGFERAQTAATPKDTARLVAEYRLPREALQPEHLKSIEVWDALLGDAERGGMPMTALIRNLPTMTRIGLLEPMGARTAEVAARIVDAEALKKARVHPFALLVAHLTYASGHSLRGSSTWQPAAQIVDALDAGFYAAFGAVESTGKAHLLALDVSGSMSGPPVQGIPGLSPYLAAAAMALVTAATEPRHEIVAFTSARNDRRYGLPAARESYCGRLTSLRGHSIMTGLTPLTISPRQRLDDVVRMMQELPMGGTDCALPWIYARERSREVDVCVTYTDNETWAGETHPTQELERYRREANRPTARAVVAAMVANEFTVADPRDPGQMDVVGFDAAAPGLIADFAAGRL